MDVLKLREYEALSPFEIKDFLARAASKTAGTAAVTYLNAGRGNPKLGRLSVARDGIKELAAVIGDWLAWVRAQFIEVGGAFGPSLTARVGGCA